MIHCPLHEPSLRCMGWFSTTDPHQPGAPCVLIHQVAREHLCAKLMKKCLCFLLPACHLVWYDLFPSVVFRFSDFNVYGFIPLFSPLWDWAVQLFHCGQCQSSFFLQRLLTSKMSWKALPLRLWPPSGFLRNPSVLQF